MTVECVVVNWKRPENIPSILSHLRPQCDVLTLINAGEPIEAPLADEVVTLKNRGGINRYAMATHSCDYTYFHDDDMLPGSRLIEHFLKYAPESEVLGQDGRIIKQRYTFNSVPRTDKLVDVDMVVRGYFVKTTILPELFKFRINYKNHIREDDMALAWATRLAGGRVCITPKDDDPETLMNKTELPAPHALSAQWDHESSRNSFWFECCRKYGK